MIFRTTLVVIACFATSSVLAQYKYIGPDGRVVYSDSPPPANVKGVQKKDLAAGAQSAGGASNLPFALQQVSRNFPVTLYTTANCGGCDQGRAYLSKRGIPFSEKTVKSNEDIEALKQQAGATSLPALLVGGNQQVGFEPGAWGELLDTAGYPPTSQLPPSYKAPAATPTVPEKPAPTAQAQPKPEAATPPAPSPPAADTSARPGWFKGL